MPIKKNLRNQNDFIFIMVLSVMSLSMIFSLESYGDEPAPFFPTTNTVLNPSVETNALSEASSSQPPSDIPETEVQNESWGEILMLKGDLHIIKVSSLTRLSVGNPEVADISNADTNQVVMLAKKAGQTAVFLWDEHGKRIIIIRVFDENLHILKAQLEGLLKRAKITEVSLDVSDYEGKIIAMGALRKDKKEDFLKIVAPFGNSVRNLVKEEIPEDLVQIDVQIAELNASVTKTLGLDWSKALTYKESPGNFIADTSRDVFKVGPLSRTTQIMTTLNALITEGKGRVLSKPKLVVISGKEASFQVGGQIPVSTTTTSTGGNVQQNVEFKDYGITLTITPTIKDNKVDVVMNVDVSDIDQSNAVGQNVAFTTRNAKTQLFLENGQSVVLAGLIKHNEGQTVSKVPFLGDIPILGLAFRFKTSPSNTDTELVLTLTPTIIRQKDSAAEHVLVSTSGQPGATSVTAEIKREIPPTEEKALNKEEPSKPETTEAQTPTPMEEKVESALKPAANAVKETPDLPTDEAVNSYAHSIQEKISQAITYPFEAKEKGWEGIVKLNLHILRDGSLADVSIKESSGHSVFDQDALNTAQILAPYNAFPDNLKQEELILTAPIVYSQQAAVSSDGKSNAKNSPPEPTTPAEIAFAESVQEKISDAIVYPEEAQESGWEGTVMLSLHILSDGTLSYSSVKKSSGYDIFDDAALQTAKKLAPYSGFPAEAGLQELSILIPISYSLERQ